MNDRVFERALAYSRRGLNPVMLCIMQRSYGPIPATAIGLADAFDLFVEQAYEENDFYKRIDDPKWLDYVVFEREASKEECGPQALNVLTTDVAANVFFRLQLDRGLLEANVLDPRTGTTLRLSNFGWLPNIEHAYRLVEPLSDFIDTADDMIGPEGSIIAGKMLPVFFEKSAYREWMRKLFPRTRNKGRPADSGSFRIVDEPLVLKMHEIIIENPTISVPIAALKVSNEACGPGTSESKAKRLERRYVRKFRSL